MASFNQMMNIVSKGASEIANEIASSSTFKAIIPGKAGFAEEVTTFINSNNKVKVKLQADKIEKKIATTLQKSKFNIDEDIAQKAAQSARGSSIDDIFANVSQSLQENGIEKEQAEKAAQFAKKNAQKVLDDTIDEETLKIIDRIGIYPQAYFSNPNKKIRNTRIATAAGTYAGIAIGGRYLSGGTLTTDSYGQKDIAGVPFI